MTRLLPVALAIILLVACQDQATQQQADSNNRSSSTPLSGSSVIPSATPNIADTQSPTDTPSPTTSPSQTPGITSTSTPTETPLPTATPTPAIISVGNANALAEVSRVGEEVFYFAIFSPTDEEIAAAYSSGVVFYDSNFSTQLDKIELDIHPSHIAYSRDGALLAAVSGDGPDTVRIFERGTGELLNTISQDADIYHVAFSPDGHTVATGSSDGFARIWDAATGALLNKMEHDDYVGIVTFSPDSQVLATASRDLLHIWDAESGELLKTNQSRRNWITSLSFSPDGTMLAAGDQSGVVRLWDSESWASVGTLQTDSEADFGAVWSVDFSPDGSLLALGRHDGIVDVWNIQERGILGQIKTSLAPILSVEFSPDGSKLLLSNSDGRMSGTAEVYEVQSGAMLSQQTSLNGYPWLMAFSSDGHALAVSWSNGTVSISDAESLALLQIIEVGSEVFGLAYSPSGDLLAAGLENGNIKIWDAATFEEIVEFKAVEQYAAVRAFSPDGSRLLSTSSEGQAVEWDTLSWTQSNTYPTGANWKSRVWSGDYSPDGTMLAVGTEDEVQLWNLVTGERSHTLSGHSDVVQSLDFSPTGETIATTSDLGDEIIVYDVATGEQLLTLIHPRSYDVAYSPDGTILASTGRDSLNLWNAENGELLLNLEQPERLLEIAFSPDGRTLYATSIDGFVRAWRVTGSDSQ